MGVKSDRKSQEREREKRAGHVFDSQKIARHGPGPLLSLLGILYSAYIVQDLCYLSLVYCIVQNLCYLSLVPYTL